MPKSTANTDTWFFINYWHNNTNSCSLVDSKYNKCYKIYLKILNLPFRLGMSLNLFFIQLIFIE